MRVTWVRFGLLAALAATAVACSTPTGSPPPSTPSSSSPPTAAVPGQDLAILNTLPARMAPDGVAIEVGQPNAPTTVTVYEDFQCPYCARFEHVNGPELATRAAAGGIKIHYIFASLLDHKLGGHSSARAANAARAAVEAGGFPTYHRLLFDRQPVEGTDGFTTDVLLQVAETVPALNSPAFTDAAVRADTHRQWVTASQSAYEMSQKQYPDGVPTVLIGSVDANPALYDRDTLRGLLDHTP
ncbi:DsbA family protein [Rhodococcus jostii]|uniref:DsbA family protein n=1 Tax=Rhodococcus jostii TaxID=132919 RepID=UPI003643077E